MPQTPSHTDLLIRIGAPAPATGVFPVEATIDGDSLFYGGTLVLDRAVLRQWALDPARYGAELLAALFSEPVARAYERALAKADERNGGRLRLRLQIDLEASALHAVHWERLCQRRGGRELPLAVTTQTPFSRFTGLERAGVLPLTERPVRVLVAVANPSDLDRRGLAPIDVASPLPHLIFLAACESARRDELSPEPFVGLGPKLVEAGVPAVVAMQEQVPMAVATELTRRFYEALFRHGVIDQALNEARWLLYDTGSGDWSIPVLFMRVRDGRLFEPNPLRTALQAMVRRTDEAFADAEPPLPGWRRRWPASRPRAANGRGPRRPCRPWPSRPSARAGGSSRTQGEQVFLAARCIQEVDAQRVSLEVRNQVVDALIWRTGAANEPRAWFRCRAIAALGDLQVEDTIPHLVRLVLEPVRVSWDGRQTTELSSVRLAAIGALGQMLEPTRARVQQDYPALAPLLDAWVEGDIEALGRTLMTGDPTAAPVAAFLLSKVPSPLAVDELVRAFRSVELKGATRWALANALAMVDPVRVVREAILPFIDAEAAKAEGLPDNAWRRRADWYERVAYLIGKARPRDERAHRFLERCLFELKDVWRKGRAMRAIAAVRGTGYKRLFEDLALGDLSGVAVSDRIKPDEYRVAETIEKMQE